MNGTVPNRPGCLTYIGRFADNGGCTGTQANEFSTLPANVDDVRVYNRALTPVEVSALFREGGFSP